MIYSHLSIKKKVLVHLHRTLTHYLLVGVLLLSMLLQSVHAEIFSAAAVDTPHSERVDCSEHDDASAIHKDHNTCAQHCDCATTGCHTNATVSKQNQSTATQFSMYKLALLVEPVINQLTDRFERPPRS